MIEERLEIIIDSLNAMSGLPDQDAWRSDTADYRLRWFAINRTQVIEPFFLVFSPHAWG